MQVPGLVKKQFNKDSLGRKTDTDNAACVRNKKEWKSR
jgi:hypothetical protein